MSDSVPDLRPRDQALKEIALEQAEAQATIDLADWRELSKLPAFERCFMRRVREKRLVLERSVIDGVPADAYQAKVAQIVVLKEIEQLPSVDRAACWAHLYPSRALPSQDEF